MTDPLIVLASAAVGLALGMTGVGAGALMTPILVMAFGVSPSSAISADLIATAVFRPVGALTHWRRGTVRRDVVLNLSLGSVPGALLGTFTMHAIRHTAHAETVLAHLLGAALVLGAAAMALRAWRAPRGTRVLPHGRVLVVLGGFLAGALVGLTSVGAGSLVVVLLAALYPGLSSAELVGTDLAQSIPLAAAASVGTVLFGPVNWSLVGAVLLGATPGIWVGSRFSARAATPIVRHLIIVFVLLSGLRYLGLSARALLAVAGAGAAAIAASALGRRRSAAR